MYNYIPTYINIEWYIIMLSQPNIYICKIRDILDNICYFINISRCHLQIIAIVLIEIW